MVKKTFERISFKIWNKNWMFTTSVHIVQALRAQQGKIKIQKIWPEKKEN